jgi:hypothetical protein
VGGDPDADEAELLYPDFYTDGPDAGAWVDPPVAGVRRGLLRAGDDLGTTETYGAVDAALAEPVRGARRARPAPPALTPSPLPQRRGKR